MPQLPARSLILLSCSHAKCSGGRIFDPSCRQVACFLGDQGEPFLGRRTKLLKLLKGEGGRLHNDDQKGGFRDLRPCNRQLVQGPEFGGPPPTSEIYLPAHERYCGRFFVRLTEASRDFWTTLRSQPVEILFVSALYGLLLWDELIQDYDCHFGDRTRNGKDRPVSELWKDTLTSALRDFIGRSRSAAPISTIYDLLSEEEYQHAFRWNDFKTLGVEVRHRVVRNSHGPDSLPDLATLVATQSSRFLPGSERGFEIGNWYDVGDGTSQVRFEPGPVTELDQLKESLKREREWLARVPCETLEDVALAEALWRNFQATRNLPPRAVVISFATAVEGFLRYRIPTFRPNKLSDFAKHAHDRKELAPAREELKSLSLLRNPAAHRDKAEPTRVDAKNARRLAYEVIVRLVK